MSKQIRQTIFQSLWQSFCQMVPEIEIIQHALQARGVMHFPLDHFAVIDLPSRNTGIPQLAQIFSMLQFTERGQGYLPDKQNPFIWMADAEAETQLASAALPQAVLADFNLDALPREIKTIVEKYTAFAAPLFAWDQADPQVILKYFAGRDWPLPNFAEFKTVQEFNELLAWVLIFGRQPNHFTLAVHLLDYFESLESFNQFLVDDLGMLLNTTGGVIKGGEAVGIAQSAITSRQVTIQLDGGEVVLPQCFIEFVWRYPKVKNHKPVLWKDYFTDFVAANADDVVESLYKKEI
jgi:hypothetical protein